jgi:hypothetical protein
VHGYVSAIRRHYIDRSSNGAPLREKALAIHLNACRLEMRHRCGCLRHCCDALFAIEGKINALMRRRAERSMPGNAKWPVPSAFFAVDAA